MDTIIPRLLETLFLFNIFPTIFQRFMDRTANSLIKKRTDRLTDNDDDNVLVASLIVILWWKHATNASWFSRHTTPSCGLFIHTLQYYPPALIISVIWPLTDYCCWFGRENLDLWFYNCWKNIFFLYCRNYLYFMI